MHPRIRSMNICPFVSFLVAIGDPPNVILATNPDLCKVSYNSTEMFGFFNPGLFFTLLICAPKFLPSFLRSFVPSFLRFFVPSYLRSFFPSYLRSFVPSYLRSFVPSFLRPFVPSSLRPFVPSSLRSFVPTFLRSFVSRFFVHSLRHSFVRSLIRPFMLFLITLKVQFAILHQRFQAYANYIEVKLLFIKTVLTELPFYPCSILSFQISQSISQGVLWSAY